MPNVYLDRITLDQEYLLRDSEARDLIAAIQGGVLSFVVSNSAANTPKDVKWGNVTGTLVASRDTTGKIYLVPASSGTGDAYVEYVTVTGGTTSSPTYSWEQLGTTSPEFANLGDLAYKNSVSLTKSEATIKNVTGASVTNGAVSVTPTTTKLAVSKAADTTSSAVTGLGTPETANFVKSYPGASSKLVTTSITPAGTATTVSKVSQGTAISVPNVTSAGSASTWAFTTAETTSGSGIYKLTITGANGTAPTLGTAKSIPVVTIDNASVSVATVGTAQTVATGSLATNGTGGSVLTGLGTAVTGAAVTDVGTPSTGSFVTAAGAPSLSTGSTGTTIVTGITSAALSSTAVTVNGSNVTVLKNDTSVVAE